jgi:nitrous oxidase accessory protein
VKTASRVLAGAGALLLLALYVVPLWSISLFAPQYPEGLGMEIHLTTVTGARPTDLQTINGLNHYIGMRPIQPESIPEMHWFPMVVAALVAIGLGAALLGSRRLVVAWLGGLAAFGALGLADFWRWAYDYGHNLDAEHAIIKVPGMTYQPPIIGTKHLLNFTATSWPAVGAWLAVLAFALGLTSLYLDRRRRAFDSNNTRRQPAPTPQPSMTPRVTGTMAALAVLGMPGQKRDTIFVSPTGSVSSIAAAIQRASTNALIRVLPGVYREPMIVVDKQVEIAGEGWPALDGDGAHQIMAVTADDVTVRGLVLRNVGASDVEDRAALRITKAHGCVIDGNRLENTFFGIYLAGVSDCRITNNVILGARNREHAAGNGIHLWSSNHITIAHNRISRHRDGIYFEFVRSSDIEDNTSEGNIRYGLHFMYSDDCRYVANTFRANGAGVAVMYTKRVAMLENRFEHNWGSAAYGLLLKEVYDVRLENNRFAGNTVGLVADGANRIQALHNDFDGNGWALKLMASTDAGHFERNNFLNNTFDVVSNSRQSSSEFTGNYWDAYRGYDLNHDGAGDVPYHPVRLFSLLAQANEPALILLRSPFVALLDAAERALPTLTPVPLVDRAPSMRRVR